MRHVTDMPGTRAGARFALACAACLLLPTIAAAQQAPLAIEVRPGATAPAWLDPPNVAIPNTLPGSQQRLVFQDTFLTPNPATLNRPDRGGRDALPRPNAFQPPGFGR